MAKFYENLLTIAGHLLDVDHVGTAARRRAISTAYYAAFRRFASLCALWFALPPSTDREAYDAVLRSLDHKRVRDVLNKNPAQDLVGKEIGKLFGELLSAREWADYSSSPHVSADKANSGEILTRAEAAKFISDARAIITAIDALDERSSHKLAVLLAFSGKR